MFWLWIFNLGIIGAIYVAAMPNRNTGNSANYSNDAGRYSTSDMMNDISHKAKEKFQGFTSNSVTANNYGTATAPVNNWNNTAAPVDNVPASGDKISFDPEFGYKIVQFGSYPQGLNGEYSPVRWRVLSENNGFSELVSVDALESRPFDNGNSNNWSNCAVRTFLNNEFFNTAFNETEKEAVVMKNNVTLDPFGKNPSTTQEKVYLLSIQDVKNLNYSFDPTISKSASRYVRSTAFAKSRGIYISGTTGNCFWWLRNPGTSSDTRTIVTASGSINSDLNVANSNNANGGVRPAITVKTSALH